MQIADWLQRLGLQQYSQRFVENGIDIDALADLTEQDLESLGVLLGHRRKLLRAIGGLRAEAPPVQTTNHDNAERRQITLMFCDIVGSTALAAQLDPEDMRAIIRAYQDCCTTVVSRYDGFIAQFTGDGVMVYFGYPVAHEDDAERAVRAGLDILTAVAQLTTPRGDRLQVRIGIATGRVVVGDLIGEGAARERAVVGDTPNLAARLQALAPPGAIVVSAATRRLLGDRFSLRTLGSVAIKGFAEPVEPWFIEGALAAESRFEAARAGRLTGFVGRNQEFALLANCRVMAWRGEGQIVLISGEAGIGKSRFVSQFCDTIADESHFRLRHQCSPYHTASMLHPVIEQVRRAAKLQESDTPDTQLDKLEAVLTSVTPEMLRAAPLFAALLSIPPDSRYPPLRLSAVQQRRQTLAALLDQLECLARKKPLLMLFEDVHWADATTLELLDLMVDRVRHLPVLVLMTHRPDFESAWVGLENVSQLTLGRLNHEQVQTMISWLTSGKQLPGEVTEQIFTKTDGIPLFVEELTKAVLESQLLVEQTDNYRIDGKLPPLAIPVTLQDSLMARLDRLAPVREIAQVGAAIGREFSYALLSVVAERPTPSLDSALEQLEAAELIFRSGTPPQSRYRFKHALVRDAAYESLLKSRRQILHRRIAEALRDQFSAIATTEPEVIAQHFAEAGLTEHAIDWWTTAGEQASRRSAYTEAAAHYRDAIALADLLPDEPATRHRLIRLYVAYGDTLHNSRSPGALETTAAFTRARELAAGIADVAERYPLYLGLWTSSVVRADVASMRKLASSLLDDVEHRHDPAELGLARRFTGVLNWMVGDPMRGRPHLEAAVAAYETAPDHRFDLKLDLHPGVPVMLQLALTLWLLGEATRAQELATKALALAVESGHVPTVVYGYTWKGTLDILRGDNAATIECAEAISRLGREHDLPFWLAIAAFFKDWARWQAGEPNVGLVTMQQSLEFFIEHGLTLYSLLFRTLFAAPQAAMSEIEAGLATLNENLVDMNSTGLRWLEAETHRQRAELHMSRGTVGVVDAEQDYQRAIDIARDQRIKSFELRAALGLARLYFVTGRAPAGQALLRPLLLAFSNESGLPEVDFARRLLDSAMVMRDAN